MIKPIVVSCGEPAGVGPEVVAKAFVALAGLIPMAYVGDPRHLPNGTPIVEIADLNEVDDAMAHGLPLLRHDFFGAIVAGQPDPKNAQGVIDVIAKCVDLVMSGAASGLCTAPIHKEALKHGADFGYPGHTEYLQALAKSGQAVMMLASDALRVVPTTIHIAIEDVPKALTPALLRDTITITHAELKSRFGISNPRIAVAGLNPHAGEGGTMGSQEVDWMKGEMDKMRTEGFDVLGPLPADTMFHAAARARYDVAVCMYHDQALIPIKTLDFDRGVNVTLGLPFIRTSPDHGTAFDIAGQGIANPTSMIEALKLAYQLAQKQAAS
jgi:4-hydroxythreonine-4-phosphate dehydrogenase